jgi:hypothetical protein
MSPSIAKAALVFRLLPVFLLPSSALLAAEITLDVQVGFHGLFQLGRPFPIRVEITNQGPPVEGTIEATVWRGVGAKGSGAFPVYHRRRLFVGAETRKSAWFTIDPGSVSRPLVVGFRGARSSAAKEIDLRRHFTPQPLILLLSESHLASALPLVSGSANSLVAISPAELPADARAYGGVATLVLYEPSMRDLSGAQSGALETWLASGGRIVVLGSLHYALYQEPSLARFLPVSVSGVKKFDSLPGVEKAYGISRSPLTNVAAQDATLLDGKSVIAADGSPILVEADRGKGKIVYLALDVGRPPLSRWEGLAPLFRDLVARGETRNASTAAWDEAVFSRLLLNPAVTSIYVPIRAFFLAMVFYLVLLGVLTWLWQSRRVGGRALGLYFVTLVVLTSAGGYVYFVRGGKIPDAVLITSTLLEPLAGGYVEASSNVALFSTLRRDYDLTVEKGWTDFEPLPRRSARAEDNALTVEEEGSRPRFHVPLKEWDYRLFKVRSVARLPVRVEFDARPGARRLKVTNESAQDLTECWMLVSGERASLGDIPAGASRTREFPFIAPFRRDGRSGRADLGEIRFNDPLGELLVRNSFFPSEQRSAWAGGALFFGWVRGAPRGIAVEDGRILARDFTLFRAVFPSGEEEE